MDRILEFIRTKLETRLVFRFGLTNTGIGYHNSTDWDPMTFQNNQISLLLVNIEEEKLMRPDHLYKRKNEAGKLNEVQPELRLNLYLLMVAKFSDNREAWKQLHEVIAYFQAHPFFNADNAPDIPQDVHKLVLELVSMSFSEQNEIWSTLKAPYHPSVLYKIRALIVQEEEISKAATVTELRQQFQGS